MADGKNKGAIAVAVVIGLLVLVAGVLWVLRGTIATSVARGQLEERAITCDDRFAVSLSATFDTATIGPTRCEHAGGLLEAVELLGEVTVQLNGTEPETVAAESLRIVLRGADVRGGSGWARELSQLGLEQRVAGMVKGLSELGAMALPAVDVTTVEVVRGGSAMATASRLTLGGGTPTRFGAARIHFEAGPGAIGQLTLTRVTGELGPGRAQLAGRADASVGVAILRVNRGGPFTMEATGLDTAAPSFTLDGDF